MHESSTLTRKDLSKMLVAFHDNLVKVMDKKFSNRIDGCATKEDVKVAVAGCATQEQFRMLDNRIASIDGRLADIQINVKAFVVRDELPLDVVRRLRVVKSIGRLAVAEDSSEYDTSGHGRD